MSDRSSIEWTATRHADGTVTPGATWNPITGCSMVSDGCTHCYAMQLAGTRLRDHPSRAGLTRKTESGRHVWTGEVRFNEEWIDQPLRWRRPRMVFVCAHGDLFHESVPDAWIDRVFAVMALARRHVFQVLTKRPKRMRQYMERVTKAGWAVIDVAQRSAGGISLGYSLSPGAINPTIPWPIPNVWLGTSVENQETANERIPDLLATPAAVRWVSAEPLLGPVDLMDLVVDDGHPGECHCDALFCDTSIEDDALFGGATLDWVVVGGESGSRSRPMHPQWARDLRDQCATYGVPFFFKQWGDHAPGEDEKRFLINRLKGQYSDHTWVAVNGDWGYCCIYDEDGDWEDWSGDPPEDEDVEIMHRAGKKAAGRILDGREWNEMPEMNAVRRSE